MKVGEYIKSYKNIIKYFFPKKQKDKKLLLPCIFLSKRQKATFA
jgi:hypothetical protein